MIYALGALWVLFTLLGDTVGAAWLANHNGLRDWGPAISLIGGIYCLQSWSWVTMMAHGLPMGRGSAIFACLGLGIGVMAGVYFGERLTSLNYTGLAFAFAAICLLAR